MKIKNVTVAGSGVLGYQIAFQTAFKGFNVTVYDINEEAITKAQAKFEILSKKYQEDLGATPEQLKQTKANLSYSSDLAQATAQADLVIEAVPENLKIKIKFYNDLAEVAPVHTIFATNSSTLIPSQIAEATKRPKQFLALHFANEIGKHNTAEIMGHDHTDPAIFNQIVEFATNIGMIALPLHKEQPGYILNTLLVPLLDAATELLVKEVADAPTIDKTWMVATGAPIGPCGILDIIGITTAYNIIKMTADATKDPLKLKMAAYLQKEFLDKNKLGVGTGEGFYTYPNPAFRAKDFLK
ncbi:3-hydroxyacyl-CoA dehydrogenase [Myroides sp. 1354]|uniref:3-hydroxyacyl-CoA dehydrogenase n=1 Tax=unclassified Myroides TaxID=2642485 RepID=UPI002575E259|nr:MULTISPECIES: 3-hydroxyacyl-CoA dehydrogenase [unclassified Myroides]MDM1044756.1 3-hydroxyacyl-CoA dehydrogenase [Myroides sp. R163-1]MDM1055469.1 3-hydroxyacyl-CoA dehydrogenase [Myroides sp. 1354]MDM1068766.1 3-hydroxyacyl-CoA dehydrogenase [Myroides sp. 1372]